MSLSCKPICRWSVIASSLLTDASMSTGRGSPFGNYALIWPYMITSGLDYSDILKMAQRATLPLMSEFMFFNRFFGDNGFVQDPLAAQLRGVNVVRDQSFGSQPCPTWERRLWAPKSWSVIHR